MTAGEAKQTLGSWVRLNKVLQSADEKECHMLMETERKGQRRVTFLLRIHSRFNKLRAERERKEIILPKKEAANV